MKLGVVALEPREIHLRKREGSDLARVQQAGELAYRCESKVFDFGWSCDVGIRLPAAYNRCLGGNARSISRSSKRMEYAYAGAAWNSGSFNLRMALKEPF